MLAVKPLNPVLAERVFELRCQGLGELEIAQALGLHHIAVVAHLVALSRAGRLNPTNFEPVEAR